MSDETVYSFVYDIASAARAFPQVGADDLVRAVLAGVPPEHGWDRCEVYEGPSPEDKENTVCIGLRGPGAEAVQEHLVTAFERHGIVVRQVYEGGPPVRRRIARAAKGIWSAP
jgi:hypothetical protein